MVARRLTILGVIAAGLAALPGAAGAQTSIEAHWDSLSGSRYVRAGDANSDFALANGPAGHWQLLAGGGSSPQLGFIKTSNPASQTVEVFLDSLSSGLYRRTADLTSDFNPADAANGSFQLFGSPGATPELGFVKERATPGNIEVHWDVLTAGRYKRAGDAVTDFSPVEAGHGFFQLLPTGSGTAPQLAYIKVVNPGSGTVEVFLDSLSNGAYRRTGDYTSDFSPADNPNGVWQMIPAASGPPLLGFVKLRATPGTVEVHWDALSGSTYRRAGNYTSDFSPGDADNGVWNLYPGSGAAPALGFVKLHPTPPPAAQPVPVTTTPVTVVLPRPRPRRHHLHVRITISWTWNFAHSRLRSLHVGRMPPGTRIAVDCRGHGCPRPRARSAARRRVGSLAHRLDGTRYRAGDRITVTVTAPGYVGQRAEIIIRNGRLPKVRALRAPRR